ncbi:MAG: hypothetical protein LW870_02050 [Pirellula sp.]|nr:hypothetical protein [Pirellula sp.]
MTKSVSLYSNPNGAQGIQCTSLTFRVGMDPLPRNKFSQATSPNASDCEDLLGNPL